MRLLVLGSGGMLGRAVVRDATRLGHDVVACARTDLDITDPDRVSHAVAEVAPRAIVNCAGFTDVDGAEGHEPEAMRVNGDGPGHVARAAAEAGARVVHVSTDYVFDGSKGDPWLESDPVAPLQAYGRTKLAGEIAVAESGAEHAIVRTAWLFGAGGPNFVATMLRLGAERDEVTVVSDQRGGPTWTGHLAAALIEVAEREGDVGLFHASAAGSCSWYEFAVEIFSQAGVDCRVLSATSDMLDRPAPRPAFSVLVTEREHPILLPEWQEGLRDYLAERAEVRA